MQQTSGYVAFRPRARLLKLIGGELISDDVVAIAELVKNAHDADASTVTIRFEGVTEEGGEIVILDDGHGMDRDALLNRWMQPAGSSKGRKGNRRTKSGRRMLGEKGVGRFAADKLAAQLEMVSRCPRKRQEICAEFDWDKFDNDTQMLSEIKHRWTVRRAEVIDPHGTQLRMSGLRSRWNERKFRRLSTRLARLVSPFDSDNGFRIVMESDEFPDYSGELRRDFLKKAPHTVEATFDGESAIVVSLNGGREVRHEWNGNGGLKCGPVQIRGYAFDLETTAIASIGPRMEVRGWLREWSGVSVYRDGFRVWPYGEPNDDWLRLDQRRVNNPVLRLSNNQVIGFVDITRDGNPNLIDQTSREGLVQNRELDDLRRLFSFVLQLLEAERQAHRHPEKVKGAAGTAASARRRTELPEALTKLAKRVDDDVANRLKKLAAQERERREEERALFKTQLEGYADLAALGHATTALGASLAPLFAELDESCEALKAEMKGPGSRKLRAQLNRIEASARLMAKRVAMIAPIEDVGGRRRRAIDLHAELSSFRELAQPLLEDRDVEMEINAAELLRIDMRPEAFGRILHILTMNSLDWLHRTKKPKIRVETRREGDHRCEILFLDNGRGFSKPVASRAFDPGYSTKEAGGGMGLTIAREIVRQHAGEINVVIDGRRKGASVRLVLPRKRARARVG